MIASLVILQYVCTVLCLKHLHDDIRHFEHRRSDPILVAHCINADII